MSYAFSGAKQKGACLGMCATYVLICNNACNVGRTIPPLCSGVTLALFAPVLHLYDPFDRLVHSVHLS